MGKTETIITSGHHCYTDGDKLHVEFYDNEYGKRLKKMWAQLNAPIKVKTRKKKVSIWQRLFCLK